jgi:hypothetical protein
MLIIIKILLKCLDYRVLEKYNRLYKNPWFLVAKKIAKTYKLINIIIKINSIILRDANMLPFINKFSKEFAEY